MALQPVACLIPQYQFRTPNKEIATYTFFGQDVTVSGAAELFWSTNPEGTSATITGNKLIWCLDRVKVNGKQVRLLKPIITSIVYHDKDKLFVCQNEDLGITSVSAELEDCRKDFQEEIQFVWNEYGREKDSRLSSDAKKLKRRLLQYIRK